MKLRVSVSSHDVYSVERVNRYLWGEIMSQPGNSPASRDIAYVFHGYTDHEAHKINGPHILQGGKGVYVYDDTG